MNRAFVSAISLLGIALGLSACGAMEEPQDTIAAQSAVVGALQEQAPASELAVNAECPASANFATISDDRAQAWNASTGQ